MSGRTTKAIESWFPHVNLTAADAEVWDYWLAHRKPRLRSALMAASFAGDALDLQLMIAARRQPGMWLHYAPHRTESVLVRWGRSVRCAFYAADNQ